ncbi:hypothetical protein F2Q69_00047939 [Brassica cretica]|uniref:Uncharacterized protein n=1 Tax=Brassica cretica TaxID=69181 RepID=A0A8S9PYC4_BRACR|nr:hypothetical protein F2Q69_00047939 [Brassica cretica]
MQESEASLLAVHEHLRPHICAEAADRFHKRVRRIHDPVTIVVPCVVVEVEIPIPPDRSVHLGSYNGVFADTMYAVASQRGEVDKDPAEAASIKTERSRPTRYDRSTSSTLRKEIWKPRQRLASIDTANPTLIDPAYLISTDTHLMISIDTHCCMSCLDT